MGIERTGMMTRGGIGLFGVLLLCVGVGCGDDDPAAPQGDSTPVMALDVGNTWNYVMQANEPGAPLIPLSRTIVEHRVIDHRGRAITVAVEMTVPDKTRKFQPDTGRLLRNEADGLYNYGWLNGEDTTLFETPALVAPRHGQPGDRHDMGGGRFLVCVAADSLVTTGFGEVVADVYRLELYEGTVLVPDFYVVPGVGMTRYYNVERTTVLMGYDFD